MKKLLSLTLFTLLVQILAGQSAQRPKPNVLLILVDDLVQELSSCKTTSTSLNVFEIRRKNVA